MPFRPTAIRKLQCQYGPHYFGPKKRTTERLVVQTTKKRNCPAVIIVREYEVFPQYGLSEESFQALSIFAQGTSRASKLKELSDALQSKQEIEVIKKYHVSVPTNDVHIGHKCGEESGMAQRMHPAVSQKIKMLVREGATYPQEIRRALREYVRSEFKDKCPSDTNRSYYFPTLEDIRNHVYIAKLGLDFSKFDQDNLNAMIKKWKDQGSTASHFFRPHMTMNKPLIKLVCYGFTKNSGRKSLCASMGIRRPAINFCLCSNQCG